MAIKIKNIDTSDGTYLGEILKPEQEIEIPSSELKIWGESDEVVEGIVEKRIQVGNSYGYIESTSAQIAELLSN